MPPIDLKVLQEIKNVSGRPECPGHHGPSHQVHITPTHPVDKPELWGWGGGGVERLGGVRSNGSVPSHCNLKLSGTAPCPKLSG